MSAGIGKGLDPKGLEAARSAFQKSAWLSVKELSLLDIKDETIGQRDDRCVADAIAAYLASSERGGWGFDDQSFDDIKGIVAEGLHFGMPQVDSSLKPDDLPDSIAKAIIYYLENERLPPPPAEGAESGPDSDDAIKALKSLALAVADYREKHDRLGGGHIDTGRAWDLMKRAETEALQVYRKARRRVEAPNPSQDEDLDRLVELEKKATAAPWLAVGCTVLGGPDRDDGRLVVCDYDTDTRIPFDEDGIANGDFIVALRNAFPALVERVKRAEAIAEGYREVGKAHVLATHADFEAAMEVVNALLSMDGDSPQREADVERVVDLARHVRAKLNPSYDNGGGV